MRTFNQSLLLKETSDLYKSKCVFVGKIIYSAQCWKQGFIFSDLFSRSGYLRWKNWNQNALCESMLPRNWVHLTHWGRVTHICVSELTIIGSDNGLSPGRRRAIIWNNAGLLLMEPLGTNFSEISIGIQTFSFKKMHLNMSSPKWRSFFLGLNVLTVQFRTKNILPHV